LIFFHFHYGCDIVKCGIGPGSVCSTRTKTGVGIPQVTAIKDCIGPNNVQVIADGGFRHIGDFAKALGLGAVACMTGSFFAGTDKTPGWDKTEDEVMNYRGMASKEAQEEFKGKFANAEGVSTYVKRKPRGSTLKVLNEIKEGIQSAMSYTGTGTLRDFVLYSTFIKVSPSTITENSIHFKG
jgi:IMP dehydrogenase